jgi:NTP pyrophosphatase (non-canonical NTP hydrolase)
MEKKINDKLDYNTELMVITMEECGEMIEACSKAIRCEDYVDNDKLIEEVGDVLCMIGIMKERGMLSSRDLNNRIQMKKLKLLQWSNLLK